MSFSLDLVGAILCKFQKLGVALQYPNRFSKRRPYIRIKSGALFQKTVVVWRSLGCCFTLWQLGTMLGFVMNYTVRYAYTLKAI